LFIDNVIIIRKKTVEYDQQSKELTAELKKINELIEEKKKKGIK